MINSSSEHHLVRYSTFTKTSSHLIHPNLKTRSQKCNVDSLHSKVKQIWQLSKQPSDHTMIPSTNWSFGHKLKLWSIEVYLRNKTKVPFRDFCSPWGAWRDSHWGNWCLGKTHLLDKVILQQNQAITSGRFQCHDRKSTLALEWCLAQIRGRGASTETYSTCVRVWAFHQHRQLQPAINTQRHLDFLGRKRTGDLPTEKRLYWVFQLFQRGNAT